MSVEEYTRKFEELVLKCDLRESESQTIVRYLGGLDDKYSNVVELQQYSTFEEVCVLAHRVKLQLKAKQKSEIPRIFVKILCMVKEAQANPINPLFQLPLLQTQNFPTKKPCWEQKVL